MIRYFQGARGGLFTLTDPTQAQVDAWTAAGARELTEAEYQAEAAAQQAIREGQLDPAPAPAGA